MNTDMSGYKLLKDDQGHYKLVSNKGTFKGNASQVTTYAVLEHGFSKEEIDLSMSVMAERSHNAAEFGIFKSFMWSYDQGVTNENYSTLH